MEREEKFIEDKFGRQNPFRVPEGYFDDFASQLMQSLPEQAEAPKAKLVPMRVSRWHRARPIAIAAASVCIAFFGLGVKMYHGSDRVAAPSATTAQETVATSSYSAVDAMADYTMLDTDDMYAYLEDYK